jgi:hypothetical protein
MCRCHIQELGAERKMLFKTSLELSHLKISNVLLPYHLFHLELRHLIVSSNNSSKCEDIDVRVYVIKVRWDLEE